MLFRNTHIEKAVGIHITESFKPGAVRHGCRNGYHPFIPLSQLAHNSGKYICIICHGTGMGRNSRLDIKRLCSVESGGMLLSRTISLALLGQHMDQHCPLDSFGFLNDLDQSLDIMSIHRA